MPGFRLTSRAEADFDDIGAYTQSQWGRRQAESYLADLDASFHRIVADEGLGRERSDLRPGLLSHPVAKHMVFFRRRKGEVTILRILHQSQDYARHL